MRTRLRDRSRSAGTTARAIGAKLRLRAARTRDEAQTAVRRITGELAGLAERAATEAETLAEKLLRNARRARRDAEARAAALAAAGACDPAAGRRRGRLRRAVDDLRHGRRACLRGLPGSPRRASSG